MKKFTLAMAASAAALLAAHGAQANVVADPSFELGADPASPWDQASSNFGSPLCTIVLCGTGGNTAAPRTGDWWAWFGGAGGQQETASVSQSVGLLNGTASVSFWLNHGSGSDASDFVSLRVNGTPLWTYNANGTRLGQGYQQVQLDLSSFATGGSVQLEFFSITGLSGNNTNFSIDDVSVVTAPIPEPGTYGLMALGLAGLLVARRRAASR